MKAEHIQAVTPLVLGAIAGFIAVAIVFAPNMSDARAAAGFGLAGTAIGTAGGLAQSKGVNLDRSDAYSEQNNHE
ncbi:MAG TPA: hypothetical protein VE944_28965 [Nostoc sp.]|uniref:hypothetical protein n=1 Tax=Nostoc sp. TaxID=1180 RepID=UPI002D5DFE63|nr:hypothetical protein [Nostoc sp.]HYX18326.1 hypothetical protein [Nostoc sp.]